MYSVVPSLSQTDRADRAADQTVP